MVEEKKSAYKTILERRSVRSFLRDPIPEEHLNKILTAAQRAPSAGNRQPWHFYVVRNEKIRRALSEAAHSQEFVAEAPLVIVVCSDPARSALRYGERGRNLYCIQDTASAVTNILITVTELGLGCCWVGAFDENMAAQVLSLPSHLRPVAILPIGYPRDRGELTSRRPLEEVVTYLD
jgi:nitroreductase